MKLSIALSFAAIMQPALSEPNSLRGRDLSGVQACNVPDTFTPSWDTGKTYHSGLGKDSCKAWAQDDTWGAFSTANGNAGNLHGSCNNWGNTECAYTCCVLQKPDPCGDKVDDWGTGDSYQHVWYSGNGWQGENRGTTWCHAWAQDHTWGALSGAGINTGDLNGSCNAWGNHGQCEHTCCVGELFPNSIPDALDLGRWTYMRQGNCQQGSGFMGMPKHNTIKECAFDCESRPDCQYFSYDNGWCAMYDWQNGCDGSDPGHESAVTYKSRIQQGVGGFKYVRHGNCKDGYMGKQVFPHIGDCASHCKNTYSCDFISYYAGVCYIYDGGNHFDDYCDEGSGEPQNRDFVVYERN